jgi:DNA (cytosine-5)-methyltransferase 1
MDAETETLIPIVGGRFSCEPIALAENTIGRKPENGGNGDGFTEEGPMYTLNATGVHGVAQPIAFSRNDDGRDATNDLALTMRVAGNAGGMLAAAVATHDVAGTMLSRNTSGGFSNSIDHAAAGYMAIQQMAVRRLTPVECERLQGFPDNYTDIKLKGKATPDGPRYKALGNSMAVPVMAWIGSRIQKVEGIKHVQES